jgi:hypothetical protein
LKIHPISKVWIGVIVGLKVCVGLEVSGIVAVVSVGAALQETSMSEIKIKKAYFIIE